MTWVWDQECRGGGGLGICVCTRFLVSPTHIQIWSILIQREGLVVRDGTAQAQNVAPTFDCQKQSPALQWEEDKRAAEVTRSLITGEDSLSPERTPSKSTPASSFVPLIQSQSAIYLGILFVFALLCFEMGSNVPQAGLKVTMWQGWP